MDVPNPDFDMILGPDGPLARVLGEYEHRPPQIKMAETVWQAIVQERDALVEAGTGTGKGIAYLVPALISSKPLIIATANKALQVQLFEKDVPLVRTALGLDFESVLIKGRQNYVCLRKYRVELPQQQMFARIDGIQVYDLDALDGTAGGTDTSSYKKIIFMHHYHCYPKDQACWIDGAFMNHTPDFIRICEDYGVDWVLYGHLHPEESIVFDLHGDTWSPGETKCVVAVAAKDGKYRREGLGGDAGDVAVWVLVPSVSARSLAAMTLLLVAAGAAVLWK